MDRKESSVISAPQSRIHVLDGLRGFALLGVILMHVLQHFGVPSGGGAVAAELSVWDSAIQWLSQHVIMGKFINIFAFLFGLSFFIQMDRGAKKGVDFRKRFLWRMVVLFGIGIVGNSFFSSDILSIYAAFGVIMVLVFPLKNWVLVSIALLLLVGTPRIVATLCKEEVKREQVGGQGSGPVAVNAPASGSRVAAIEAERSSFWLSAKANLTTGFVRKLNYQFGLNGRGYVTLALFMLGLVVGRLRFFEGVEAHKRRNVLLFGAFALATLLLSAVPVQEVTFRMLVAGDPLTPAMLASMALKDGVSVLFSGALALGFIVLSQLKGVSRCLRIFIPYGRMGLTNYLTQSIVGGTLFSFWGFGAVVGAWGITEVFVLGLVIYALQAVVSHYWLKRYLYGPLEWFWRSATYLKLQPFR